MVIENHNALYRTATLPMTLSDVWGHFSPTVTSCAQLTRDLLAIAKLFCFNNYTELRSSLHYLLDKYRPKQEFEQACGRQGYCTGTLFPVLLCLCLYA